MSWQACPICHGKGTVAHGFYEGTGYATSTSTARPTCRACKGKGIMLDPTTPVGGAPYRVDWNRVTSSSHGGFNPARYHNATTAVLT